MNENILAGGLRFLFGSHPHPVWCSLMGALLSGLQVLRCGRVLWEVVGGPRAPTSAMIAWPQFAVVPGFVASWVSLPPFSSAFHPALWLIF